ncbi:unnamed protein product [Prorocentrum cordatum]|uniref:DNA (cytosine-5-)-methyltransferase n=1 Tax=Prorocentrum cordatum TaxID=2364126 RepID=A0ABN9VWZ6_9DINO|nr:unnamed protein product [Polarella glacialis]
MFPPWLGRVADVAGAELVSYLSRCPPCPSLPAPAGCNVSLVCPSIPPCPALPSVLGGPQWAQAPQPGLSCGPCPAPPTCPGEQVCRCWTLSFSLFLVGVLVARMATTQWVYVWYAGENKWHQHLNLGRIALSRSDHVIYTADGDMYIIQIQDNPDIQATRFGTYATPPVGLRRADVYGFRQEPTQAEVRQLVVEAEEVAGQECRRRAELIGDLQVLRGLKVLVPPGGAAAAGPAAPPPGPAVGLLRGRAAAAGATPRAGGVADVNDGVWRVAACVGDFRVGDEIVEHVPSPSHVGDRDLRLLPSGEALFVEFVTSAALPGFLQRAVGADARILPVTRNERGKRELTWSAMVELTNREEFDASDWGLPGPRTADWRMDYILNEGLGVEGHREHFRSIRKLAASDWGVQEHYQLSLQLEQALYIDMLDGSNLVSVETKFRRMQTIEFAHWDKAKDQESKGIGGKLSGVTRAHTAIMICPDLIEHVRAELEREGKLNKNLRLAREERESRDVTRAVDALNWLNDSSTHVGRDRSFTAGALSLAQRQCLTHISSSVEELGAPPRDLSPAEALRQLRVAGGGYCVEESPLGSYGPALVSLPDGKVPPVPLSDVWGDGGISKVELFVQQSLLPADVAAARLDAWSVKTPYSDPRLRCARDWEGFARDLHARNLVDFSLDDGVRVDAFFVKKKGGRLRMVIDCRRSNVVFADPAPVVLPTGDSFAALELDDPEGILNVEGVDLKDAFYHLELPIELRRYFVMRPILAGSVGVSSLGGSQVAPAAKLFPRLKVVPMGWSWALWWCQSIMERIAEQSGCPESQRLHDGRPAPGLSEFGHLQYVDNFVSFGYDRVAVRAAVARVAAELGRRGLVVALEDHAGEHEGTFNVLGWDIAASGRLSASGRRLWRARLAVRCLLRRGRCCGADIERILGHLIFIALVRREGLSLFEACFRFVQTSYHVEAPLPGGARTELAVWDGLAPLLWRDLKAGWSMDVGAVDASPWGLGACQSTWAPAAVKSVGRYCERWRFGRAERLPPRRRALAASQRALGQAIAAEVGDPASGGPGLVAFASAADALPAEPVGPPLERDLAEFPEHEYNIISTVKHDITDMPIISKSGKHDISKHDKHDISKHEISKHGINKHSVTDKHDISKIGQHGSSTHDTDISTFLPSHRRLGSCCPASRPSPGESAPPLPVQRKCDWHAGAGSPPESVAAEPAFVDLGSLATGPPGLAGPPRCSPGRACRAVRPPPGVQVLNAAAVRTARGREAYQVLYTAFVTWARSQQMALSSAADVDKAAVGYLRAMFNEGKHLTYANRLIAAIAWMRPEFSRHGQLRLPRAKQAAVGWKNLAPPKSRQALPIEVVFLIVNWILFQRSYEAALAARLLFEIYGRPGEIHKLRAVDLVPPLMSRGAAHRFWSLTLHAAEVGDVSKTNEFDNSVRLDLPRHQRLAASLDWMLARRWGAGWRASALAREGGAAGLPGSLFLISPADVSQEFRRAVTAFGLRRLGAAHLCQLRHAGPSHDSAASCRTLEEMRRRGRWRTWSSVRRYEKGSRLTEVLHPRLSAPVILELFSGHGGFARAAGAMGFWVLVWDLSLGEQYDLTRSENRAKINAWLRAGPLRARSAAMAEVSARPACGGQARACLARTCLPGPCAGAAAEAGGALQRLAEESQVVQLEARSEELILELENARRQAAFAQDLRAELVEVRRRAVRAQEGSRANSTFSSPSRWSRGSVREDDLVRADAACAALTTQRMATRRAESEEARSQEALEHLRQELRAAQHHGEELRGVQQDFQLELESVRQAQLRDAESFAERSASLEATTREREEEASARQDAVLKRLQQELRAAERAQQIGAEALTERDTSLDDARHELGQSHETLQQHEEASASREAVLESLRRDLLSEEKRAESEEAHSQEALEHLRQKLRAAQHHGEELRGAQQELQLELESVRQARHLDAESFAERSASLEATTREREEEALARQDAVLKKFQQELRAAEHAQQLGAEALSERDASLDDARRELGQSHAMLQQHEEASASREAVLESLRRDLLAEEKQAESENARSQEALQHLRQELRASHHHGVELRGVQQEFQLEFESMVQALARQDAVLKRLQQELRAAEHAQHIGAEALTERDASLENVRRELGQCHSTLQQHEEASASREAVLESLRRDLLAEEKRAESEKARSQVALQHLQQELRAAHTMARSCVEYSRSCSWSSSRRGRRGTLTRRPSPSGAPR